MRRAVFLDRDGVINQTVLRRGAQRAPQDFSEFAFVDGVEDALATLHRRGYVLLVCTNQPDVSRGWQRREQVEAFHQHILTELPIAQIYACFHDRDDGCECRKPKPGMLLAGAREHGIVLAESYMVGDRESDMVAGAAAGCRTVFLRHPGDGSPPSAADYELRSLRELVGVIA